MGLKRKLRMTTNRDLGGHGGHGGHATVQRGKLSVRYRISDSSRVAPETRARHTPCPPDDIEADERDAIAREADLATRQSAPQAAMIAGLLKASRWSVDVTSWTATSTTESPVRS
jgi:hypothetical protein